MKWRASSAERSRRTQSSRARRKVAKAAAKAKRPSSAAAAKARAEGAGEAIHEEFGTETHLVAEYRPVSIVDTSEKKKLELRIEVPVEDMAKLGQPEEIPSGPASQGPARQSIWTAIHPRLLELILAHRSTLIFVNSRRIAERLASALNELAGEVLVRSHHGSLARPQRIEVEDRLKAGQIRGLVATSSLELGHRHGRDRPGDPDRSASIGRERHAAHRKGGPHHRRGEPRCDRAEVSRRPGRLCSRDASDARSAHRVEPLPAQPLDVVAQQIVAMVAMDSWHVDDLYVALRGAAPFADLSRSVYEGVLDMLSGRYPSDDFADLRPRITWDRLTGTLTRT